MSGVRAPQRCSRLRRLGAGLLSLRRQLQRGPLARLHGGHGDHSQVDGAGAGAGAGSAMLVPLATSSASTDAFTAESTSKNNSLACIAASVAAISAG